MLFFILILEDIIRYENSHLCINFQIGQLTLICPEQGLFSYHGRTRGRP